MLNRNRINSIEISHDPILNHDESNKGELEIMVITSDSEEADESQTEPSQIEQAEIVIEGVIHKETSIQAEPEPESSKQSETSIE